MKVGQGGTGVEGVEDKGELDTPAEQPDQTLCKAGEKQPVVELRIPLQPLRRETESEAEKRHHDTEGVEITASQML